MGYPSAVMITGCRVQNLVPEGRAARTRLAVSPLMVGQSPGRCALRSELC